MNPLNSLISQTARRHDRTPTAGWASIGAPLLSLILLMSSVSIAPAAVHDENLLGRYELASAVNDGDRGELTRRPGNKLRWEFDNGTKWDVTPDIPNGVLTGSTDITLQFLGAAGNSAVEALIINGETFFRKFTVNSTWATTATANYLIDGPWIVWWDTTQDFSAHAAGLLADLKEVRNRCWSYGMWDTPTNRADYYQNLYLHSDTDTLGWPKGNGVGTEYLPDPDNPGSTINCPYITIAGAANYDPQQPENWGPNHYHEGYHLFQYSANSDGFEYTGDTAWFVEASANWFARIEFPANPTAVSAIWSNPQLPMWRSFNFNNAEPWEPANWNREVQQYARDSFLYYLTELKGVPRSYIVDGYYSGTTQSPQEYLLNRIGPALFRQHFTDWTAHNAAYFDYFSRALWNQTLDELSIVGDPNDINPYITDALNGGPYVDSGTGGAWVSPPSDLTPRSWAYNLYQITTTSAATYTFQLDGGATGTEGAVSIFSGTVVVMDPGGNQFHPLTMSNDQDGSVSVVVPATATEVFLVINTMPDQFSGNQNYPYQVKIDRLPAASFAVAPAADDHTAISMTATTGTGGVEFLFTETSGNPGGTSSAWQASPSYTDSGLDPSTQYIYTVTMRDVLAVTSLTSDPASATTDSPPDLTPPSPGSMSFAVAPAPTQVDGDPLSILSSGTLAGNNPATGAPWTPGDTYRLAFVTSTTTQATSTDIATYNAFVQDVASDAGLGGATWNVAGSTSAVAARDNTDTNPGTDGTGVAVYLMDGTTVLAANNSDLWDGANAALILDENGVLRDPEPNRIFTGSTSGGTASSSSDGPLGNVGDIQTGRSDTSGGNWMSDWKMAHTSSNSVYALSDPITLGVAGDPETHITMTATTATDASGVEYYFDETTGNPGGSDSGWQDSPVYTDSGLQPGTTYLYTVTARDKSPNQNSTTASAAASATTAGSSGFNGWALGPFPSGLPLSDPDPLLDYDGGGLSTSIERVLGGDPTDGSDDIIVAPTFDNSSDVDYFIYSYRLSNEVAADPNTTVVVEYGSDLVGWTEASDDGSDILATSVPGAQFATVEVKLKRTLAVGDRFFARLKVVLTP